MIIAPKSVIADYQALRAAAKSGAQNIEQCQMTAHNLDILSASVDENPATQDQISTSHFNGDNSSAEAKLVFTERQIEGKQVLEFSATQPKSLYTSDLNTSVAQIDLGNGQLLSASGTGNFIVAEAQAPVVVTPPAKPDYEAQAIRASYAELKTLVAEQKIGSEFFVENIGQQVTLEQAAEGLIGVSYWGGAFSGPNSGTLRETFREFKEDGLTKLAYSKTDDSLGEDIPPINRTLTI